MKKLASAALLLVVVLVSLSAYLRLDNSGIGCTPWPSCYGNIGAAATDPSAADTYQRLLEEARQPMSWATPLHRLVASVLGLLVLALAIGAVMRRNDRLIAFTLVFLTVFLAWLGIYSEGLHNPAVVMGNLGGGFAMLGVLGWMVLRRPRGNGRSNTPLGSVTAAALAVLCLQIALGGLTSANFAAPACRTLPDCHGSWLPGRAVTAAFDLTEPHRIGPTGMVLGGAERMEIHKLHRLVALLTLVLVATAGIGALRAGLGTVGALLLTIVLAEFAVGVAAILTELPIAMAVAHNWLAAMMLLVLLRLLAETGPAKSASR